MKEYKHDLLNIQFNTRVKKSHHKKNDTYKITKYIDDIFTFDIETTSAYIDENGQVIGYTKGKSADYWNNLEPLALPYIWQFSYNDTVYYGREFIDFLQVLTDLPQDANIIIWVHNLSFEFAFLCGILTTETVFARTPHKPMKCVFKEFPLIEFRCSYMLTRLSLDAWGKQIGTQKLTGLLDYEQIRTPYTELTNDEMAYREQDCIVVYKGIQQYLKQYVNQWDIPLTQTGTVRRVVKELLTSNDEYVKHLKKLVPKDAKQYKLLLQIFAGGYTHANRFYAGRVIDAEQLNTVIEHYDYASSYPAVMCAEKYPMSAWLYDTTETIPPTSRFNDYAYIMELEFIDIESISFNTYIQASKCTGENFVFDNGRIISASLLHITVTEQDYLTIIENYKYKSIKLCNLWESKKDYLPRDFILYILELYGNKTTLKGVEGQEDLYLQSKQYINSLFGMCVTALVQADVKFNNGEWQIDKLTEEVVTEKLNKLRSFSPYEKRYFLNFSWGCYVTAYARRNLWRCIHSIDHDVLYCDTDSIFCKGVQDFKWYNIEITDKLKTMCNELKIDFELTRPKTPKGKNKPLGIFDKEDNCIQFITLGAKRYCERRTDGKLYITVAGINKGAVAMLNDDINNFRDGFVFDKDDDSVTKKLCTYITDMPTVQYNDGYVSHYTHGINLRRTGYDMSLTDEYNNLIRISEMIITDEADSFYNSLRKWWE